MLYRTHRLGTNTNIDIIFKMYVVTPRYMYALLLLLLLWRSDERVLVHNYPPVLHNASQIDYTAGIEVAPHYHQLLVVVFRNFFCDRHTLRTNEGVCI